MAKRQVFSIYDSKAEAHLQPFFMDTVGMATRAVQDCLSDPEHQFNRHPEDYTLFHLGTFDDANGEFSMDIKKSLGNLIELFPPALIK